MKEAKVYVSDKPDNSTAEALAIVIAIGLALAVGVILYQAFAGTP